MTIRFLTGSIISVHFFLYLIPQLLCYTIPLSCLLSIGFASVDLKRSREAVVLQLLSGARQAWHRSIVSLVGSVGILFFVCLGWWGPHWYSKAKVMLIADVAQTIARIEPQRMMQVSPELSVWYAQRVGGQWQDARIGVLQKAGSYLLFAAQSALPQESSFILINGSVTESTTSRQVQHRFKKMVVPYSVHEGFCRSSVVRRPKHYTVSELVKKKMAPEIIAEFARRSLQLLLFFLMPWGMLVLCQRVKHLTGVIGIAGCLLILLHVLSALVSGPLARILTFWR